MGNDFNWGLICWHKTNPTPLTAGGYLPDTEYILHFWKGKHLRGAYRNKRRFYVQPSTKNTLGHPTVKPLNIVRNLVLNAATAPGSVILDPFMGSGTTGVAAIQLGHTFVGIEMNGDYLAVAKRRIAQAWPDFQLTLDLKAKDITADIPNLNYHELHDLKTATAERMKEMRDIGITQFRATIAEQATILGVDLKDSCQRRLARSASQKTRTIQCPDCNISHLEGGQSFLASLPLPAFAYSLRRPGSPSRATSPRSARALRSRPKVTPGGAKLLRVSPPQKYSPRRAGG